MGARVCERVLKHCVLSIKDTSHRQHFEEILTEMVTLA